MEPQINITCQRTRKNKCCGLIVLTILIALFTFAIGLLVGAAIAETVLANLAAFIILAVILFILIVIKIIMMLCERRC